MDLTPVHFFSHGSTMMLGEKSDNADYWRKCGEEALARGIKGVIIMGAHWDSPASTLQVSTNPNPGKSPVAYVHPDKYTSYKLTPDLATASRIISMLQSEGFSVSGNDTFDWIHDVYLILIHMFPDVSPPTTIVSCSARYDPHFHVKIGSTLRPLRQENYLLIGTGGAVHNLYRNRWAPMLRFRDNFAMETPPEEWALEFRQAVEDVLIGCNGRKGEGGSGGPRLRRAVARLMKHPRYRDAHATDDHFMAAMFFAGALGDWEDEGSRVVMGAEDWELTNMCNSSFSST